MLKIRFTVIKMTEELGTKVNGLWEECTSLEETPRAHPDSIDGFEYTIVIKNRKVPLRIVRNSLYWFFPTNSPEKAHGRREQLIQRYGLQNDDIIVYARSAGGGFAKP